MKVYELMAFLGRQRADAIVYLARDCNEAVATLQEASDENGPGSVALVGAGDYEED